MNSSETVLIAITTFRRADQLQNLIGVVLDRIEDVTTGERFRVLVIDNDPAASARDVTEAFDDERVSYAHESRPGIASARQRALDDAGDAVAVVYLDDDVSPMEGWLPALLSTWRRTEADAVMGYVEYVWPPSAEPWVAAGGFMRRDADPTGTVLSTLATGNVLIDMSSVRAYGLSFDRSLGLSGGEDSLFGDQLTAHGGRIVACLESVARDEIPADRATRSFVRRRTLAHGQSRVRLRLRDVQGSGRRALIRIRSFVGAVVRMVVFYGLHLMGKVRGDLRRDAVGMRRTWFAVGMAQASLGRMTSEYARTD